MPKFSKKPIKTINMADDNQFAEIVKEAINEQCNYNEQRVQITLIIIAAIFFVGTVLYNIDHTLHYLTYFLLVVIAYYVLPDLIGCIQAIREIHYTRKSLQDDNPSDLKNAIAEADHYFSQTREQDITQMNEHDIQKTLQTLVSVMPELLNQNRLVLAQTDEDYLNRFQITILAPKQDPTTH